MGGGDVYRPYSLAAAAADDGGGDGSCCTPAKAGWRSFYGDLELVIEPGSNEGHHSDNGGTATDYDGDDGSAAGDAWGWRRLCGFQRQ